MCVPSSKLSDEDSKSNRCEAAPKFFWRSCNASSIPDDSNANPPSGSLGSRPRNDLMTKAIPLGFPGARTLRRHAISAPLTCNLPVSGPPLNPSEQMTKNFVTSPTYWDVYDRDAYVSPIVGTKVRANRHVQTSFVRYAQRRRSLERSSSCSCAK